MSGFMDELELTPEEQAMEQEQLGVETPTDAEIAAENAQADAGRASQSAVEGAEGAQSADPNTTPQEDKTVSLAALHEERSRRKEMSARMEKMEERYNHMVERLLPQEPEPQGPQVPDFDEDPAQNLKMRVEMAEAQNKQFQQAQLQQQQAQQPGFQTQQWVSSFQETERAFNESNPDYYDAAQWLRDSRAAEYKSLGYNDAQIQEFLVGEALQLGQQIEGQGGNPAEAFYNLAKARGFTPGSQDRQASTGKVDLSQVAAGQNANRGQGSAGANPRPITLADLAEMSDDDFDKATEGGNWQNLWG